MVTTPGFWMYETTGVLRPAVEKYLLGEEMTPVDCATMRAYLRQWINGPWVGPEIEGLRADLDRLTSREAIAQWLDTAMVAGIDPL